MALGDIHHPNYISEVEEIQLTCPLPLLSAMHAFDRKISTANNIMSFPIKLVVHISFFTVISS
jgi:hypothetical protein